MDRRGAVTLLAVLALLLLAGIATGRVGPGELVLILGIVAVWVFGSSLWGRYRRRRDR